MDYLVLENNMKKEIEEYNEQESKIKTNNIIEDVYKNNTLEKASGKTNRYYRCFRKLREMKQKIENEISNNDTTGIIKLNEESSTYGKENNTVNNIEKVKPKQKKE